VAEVPSRDIGPRLGRGDVGAERRGTRLVGHGEDEHLHVAQRCTYVLTPLGQSDDLVDPHQLPHRDARRQLVVGVTGDPPVPVGPIGRARRFVLTISHDEAPR
jgi:hypothetical protein